MAPWAFAVYACDAKYWDIYAEDIKQKCSGSLWIQYNPNSETNDMHRIAAKKYGLNMVPGRNEQGLGKSAIHFGSNSGYQAINLAYLWGAKTIILLGYDMRRINNQMHFFGDHPKALHNGPDFNHIIPQFLPLARDLEKENVKVLNCTPNSALPYFPKADLKTVLQSL